MIDISVIANWPTSSRSSGREYGGLRSIGRRLVRRGLMDHVFGPRSIGDGRTDEALIGRDIIGRGSIDRETPGVSGVSPWI